MDTLRDAIRELTRQHLDAGYAVASQTATAVGHVGNTLPDHPGITELPCSDVSNAGVMVGYALAGKRPIYVIRYQGFSFFNAAMIVNYAAKAPELWGKRVPVLVRGIAMEGAIGPVAGSAHHGLWSMPGVRIYSPMRPAEWAVAYREWMLYGGVAYLSEHRGAWGNVDCVDVWPVPEPNAVLFPISITRHAALSASSSHGNLYVCPLWKLRPLEVPEFALEALRQCGRGLVIDAAHTQFGKSIAHDLARMTGARVNAIGLEDRTAGFYRDNLPPDETRIREAVNVIA